MKRSSVAKKVVALHGNRPQQPSCVGTVARVEDDGGVYVEFPGNRGGPRRALIASTAFADLGSRASVAGRRVLLNFDRGDARAPIVVAALDDVLPPSRPAERVLRARRVTVSADEGLELTCGKSSLRMDADGRVVIKGDEVVSRGVRSNKVKGGTVSIN